MIGPRHVHPDELGDAEGLDLHDAVRVGNRLVDAMDDVPITPSLEFADGVMAALSGEPTPGTTGFLAPLRRRGVLAGVGESVRQAWASVGSGRPLLGRTAALAYVLAVIVAGVSLAGAATLGTAGALGLLSAPSPTPTAPLPTIAPQPTLPPPSVPPAPSPSPNTSEPPAGPTPSPTETGDGPEGSDDHGGNSGPGGGGDDDSGSGGGDDSSGSDDKSGSSDDSGGSDDSGSGETSGPESSGSGEDDSSSSSGSDDAGAR